MPECPICQQPATGVQSADAGNESRVSCPGCGEFGVTSTAAGILKESPGKRTLVSHWIRRAFDNGQRAIRIDERLMRTILAEEAAPTVAQQASSLLLFIGDELSRLGTPEGTIPLSDYRRISAIVGAAPGNGLMYLLRGLHASGDIYPLISQYAERVGLTFEGWKKYETLRREQVDSRIAFMAMQFGDARLDRVLSVFKNAVAATGFTLVRLDENPPAGLIDNRLRVEIRKARFTICELTAANPGAYWEGGFAEGLGRPVIYACEKSVFDEKRTHFDTNHCHTIVWQEDALQDAADRLKATIRATLPGEAKMSD